MKLRRVPLWLLTVICGLVAVPNFAADKADKIVTVQVRVDSEASGYEGFRAMDGNPETMWHTDFQFQETRHPHEFVVDLGASYQLDGVAYLPRPGGSNGTIGQYECYVSDNDKDFGKPLLTGTFAQRNAENVVPFPTKPKGRYLRLRALSEVSGQPWTSIAELRPLVEGVQFRAGTSVVDRPRGSEAAPWDELEIQFGVLKQHVRNIAQFQRVAAETYRPEALIQPSDRDPVDVVLRRTTALLADLQRMQGTRDLSAHDKQLADLRIKSEQIEVKDLPARLSLFKEICQVRRQIAFANPLLDFDKILFIKRHRAIYNHMCDQYYGMAARPGGGLYVLSDPFGPQPQIRDVLAESAVQQGRLKGRRLTGGSGPPPALAFDGMGNVAGPETDGGSFLSPDLSYDGKQILFAFVECQGDPKHRHHTDPNLGHWAEGRCYHVFKVNVDGSGLEQLTDGTWNDFDPCWLPNGRIAFITERRGGYLRCGRVCPTYTLYEMAANGSDITGLSPHETNEWHPSVTNDGRIIYTRWDYVDRFGCTAHHPWITTLDGRDSRAVHGNFAPRNARPDMELDCRAIPDSQKFVSTAAPHHGQAYGSLVLVDPRVEDDDAMAPLKRITPDVGFPESQGGREAYGTAWPLSEDYYLCIYDAAIAAGAPGVPGTYGIYLVDAFGNQELLYRDPTIACQSPRPLRARPRPSTTPVLAKPARYAPGTGLPAPEGSKPQATLTVVNTYDSLMPWPAGTKIKALRVLQVLPMSVPSGGPPHETGARVALAGDSVVPVRHVLGTVPVEADGSAHFTVPANKELFFQALDERGLAVQSMRSATYLQEGEHLVCHGCHDKKHRVPQPLTGRPLALQRTPLGDPAGRGWLATLQLSTAGAAGVGSPVREVSRRESR